MSITSLAAKHLHDVHFGGNWTTTNLKQVVSDISWQQAIYKLPEFNSIATLTFHTTYYVNVLKEVLAGKPLNAKDELSFKLPTIESQADWNQLLENAWSNAEETVELLKKVPEDRLTKDFTHEKYGSYFRNIHGIIEHMHYHLGQIVLIKKMVLKIQL